MRVEVDEAGRDDEPVGVDHQGVARIQIGADRHDPSPGNGHVTPERGRPGPVDDRPPADHHLTHAGHPNPPVFGRIAVPQHRNPSKHWVC